MLTFLFIGIAIFGLTGTAPAWSPTTAVLLLAAGGGAALLGRARCALKAAPCAETGEHALCLIAHDLRNPLSGIRAAADLLMDARLDQARRESLLRVIRDGADAALRMTDDLLDTAAARAGGAVGTPAAVDLAAVVERRADLYRMAAQAKGIDLGFDLAPCPPAWVDGARIARVLDNLVSNAVKYSPPDRRVTVALRTSPGRARLSVTDEGPGIPAHEIGGLFAPFARGSTLPTNGERSTGIGLTVVKRLVETGGGEIRVRSAPGNGSCFEIVLPLASSAPARPVRRRARAAVTAA